MSTPFFINESSFLSVKEVLLLESTPPLATFFAAVRLKKALQWRQVVGQSALTTTASAAKVQSALLDRSMRGIGLLWRAAPSGDEITLDSFEPLSLM